jgi:hypothetical protein
MYRRDILAILGTISFASGCVENERRGNGSMDKIVRLESINETPDEFGIDISIDITRDVITKDNTAQLEIELENTGDETPEIGFDTRYPNPIFSIDEHYEFTPEIVLIPPDYSPDRRSDSCWALPRDYQFEGPAMAEEMRLEPGERYSQQYTLWGRSNNEGCELTGAYDFGRRFNQNDEIFSWMFTLSVENNH